jgi:hypothetical protein
MLVQLLGASLRLAHAVSAPNGLFWKGKKMTFRPLFLALGLGVAALAGSSTIGSTSADAQQSYDGRSRWVTVYNNSRFQSVVSIHAIPPPSMPQTHDPDLIPSYSIPPGGSTRIMIDNGRGACVFNIRLTTNVYPQRQDWMFYNFNVCTQSTLSVRD